MRLMSDQTGPRNETPPQLSAWTPLRQPIFRALWTANFVSNIGTWMQSTASAWLMTSLAPSTIMVALVTTATTLPLFLLAMPAGALADVLDRRRLLLFTQSWMLAAAALLSILTSIKHQNEPWLFVPTLRLSVAVVAFLLTGSCVDHSQPLPPPPLVVTPVRASSHEEDRAHALFRMAHTENRRLEWDECLAQKAFRRAKNLVASGAFAHKDPRTGKNPAWEMVVQCDRYRYAAENLAKGDEPAEVIHRALMQSPAHRANLISSRYRFLGVGCYESVCVQLFGGF